MAAPFHPYLCKWLAVGMVIAMKYIYYPEYELEYRGLIPTPTNHNLNIRLLMFLCDHVILPPSHLLSTSTDNMLSLIKHLQEFFYAGKIVTTRYPNGIDNYFDSRIERIQDPVARQAQMVRTKQIKDLLINEQVEHNQSDEKMQLSLFDSRVKELIHASSLHKKKSLLLLDQIQSISDKTGEPIYSSQLRVVIENLLNNRDITQRQSNYFLNLMSRAYYYSGTYTMNTLVSYNDYFDSIKLHDNLLETHTGATNLIVNPYFLSKLFGVMGISSQDLYRLTVADYQSLMSQKVWNEFMAIFDQLYNSAQELDELLSRRELTLAALKDKKDRTFRYLDAAFFDVFLNILLGFLPFPFGSGASIVIALLRNFSPMAKNVRTFIQQNSTDKIMDRLERSRDPLFAFGYELNKCIRNLT